MRRRLVLVVAAVTVMVALAFLIPLGILVRDLAADRAITDAENEAESIARILIVLGDAALSTDIGATVGSQTLADRQLSIVGPDGTTIAGIPLIPGEDLSPALAGAAYRQDVTDGQAIYVPVVLESGSIAVVRAFVPQADLTSGVARSWMILGGLGALLVLLAILLADRLGRSMVAPVRALSSTAAALGEGRLDVRVSPDGPPEIEEVGRALNHMAGQISRLIETERETAADIAHRLRTPLTALRLDAEALDDDDARLRLTADLDEMERTVNFVITEARRPVRRDRGPGCDLTTAVSDRVEFWRPLGEEQGRSVYTVMELGEVHIEVPAEDAAVLIDALIENVFAHTDDGTAFSVRLEHDNGVAHLSVEDAGVGWPDASVVERGATSGDSTGLGLDIVQRTAASVGGTVALHRSEALGGAAITIDIPTVRH